MSLLKRIKDHPFAVETFFKTSVVLTFAAPKEELLKFLPDKLELDVFEDRWAFVAVAMVDTKDLRPKGFPKLFGRDFFLIGYRIFVRHKTLDGKSLRGLYIIRSETNKNTMSFFGNMFTHYNYSTTDIAMTRQEQNLKISSVKSDFNVEIDLNEQNAQLPPSSPFADWKQARRFAGPLPFTFTYDKNKILIIEGVRENWTPKPISVLNYDFSYLKSLNLKGLHLANAFIIQNIPYYWKKGRVEVWK